MHATKPIMQTAGTQHMSWVVPGGGVPAKHRRYEEAVSSLL